MVYRFFKIIVFLILIFFVSSILSDTEGQTKIDWLSFGIEIETSNFILLLIFVGFLIIFFDRVWRLLISFPKAALIRRDNKNRSKVEKNLVKALLLASHGEYKQAAKEALFISKNIQDKKLGLLIQEHAETVNSMDIKLTDEKNRNQISEKYLKILSNDKNTSLISHLASMRIELAKNKNFEKIYEHANEAYKLDQNSEQVIKTLFYVSIKLNKIEKALELSKNQNLRNLPSIYNFEILLSDLNYLDGIKKLSNNRKEALKAFSKSLEHFKGNINAVKNYIKLDKGIYGKQRSIKALKEAFFISPHSELLDELVKRNNFKSSGEKVAYAMSLTEDNEIKKTNLTEIKVLIAEYATKEKIWGEAKKIIEDIPSDDLDKKAYQVLADIASSRNEAEQVKNYLNKANNLDQSYSYYCSFCSSDNKEWHLNCKNCNQISSIQWIKRPAKKSSNENISLININ